MGARTVDGEPQWMLVLDDVVRTFGDVTALAGVTLRVAAGEVVGLLGHNGAGKTTTVRVLAGLLAVEEGRVAVEGHDPVVHGARVRSQLGVLPARPVVDDRLTARANLRFAADVFGLPTDRLDARITDALGMFDLAERADERAADYSTGMRQRLSLARVLLPDPPILLLDEPTASLDPVAARHVRDMLAALARQRDRTVLICTHDLSEAERLCDRVVVLEHGQVVADGSPAELAAEHGTGAIQVEVDPDHLPRARAVLDAVTDDAVHTDGGGRIRARGVSRDSVPAVVRRLADADVAVYELRRLDPTLEDVYLAIHGRQGADRSAPPREVRR
jgi:ABC-type multidrug transport system ATPase subunit